MVPPPLYDKWYVLAEMASVPSQLVDEVEPVREVADEKGARGPAGYRPDGARAPPAGPPRRRPGREIAAGAPPRRGCAPRASPGQAWACPLFLVPGAAVVSEVKGSPGGARGKLAVQRCARCDALSRERSRDE